MTTATPDKAPCFIRSERSPGFTRYCERVYGQMLNQYGTADMTQLDLLVSLLPTGEQARVLDAGCGTGHTTCYLAGRTQAAFLGVDKSDVSIARARQLALGAPRLAFDVADLDTLELRPASFEAVIAIESLYFPKDLGSTIARFKSAVRPGGMMGLFFTHFGDASASPRAADTRLGVALRANDLAFDAHDLTDSDREFWRRSKDTAEALRSEMEAEGNADLLHIGETDAVLDLIAKGGHARYLYQVRV